MDHTKPNITEKQKENLLRLAEYLSVGKLKAKFNMGQYYSGFDSTTVDTTCGSVGCAVGHGPYAGIEKIKGESWNFYGARQFGMLHPDICKPDLVYMFCFDDDWQYVDNTPKGVAERIQYMLKHGIPHIGGDYSGYLEPLRIWKAIIKTQ